MRYSCVTAILFSLASSLTIVSGDRVTIRRNFKRATMNNLTGQNEGIQDMSGAMVVQEQNKSITMVPLQNDVLNKTQNPDSLVINSTSVPNQVQASTSNINRDSKEGGLVAKQATTGIDPESIVNTNNRVQLVSTSENNPGYTSGYGDDTTTSNNVVQTNVLARNSGTNSAPSASGNMIGGSASQQEQTGLQNIDPVKISENSQSNASNKGLTNSINNGNGDQGTGSDVAQAIAPLSN